MSAIFVFTQVVFGENALTKICLPLAETKILMLAPTLSPLQDIIGKAFVCHTEKRKSKQEKGSEYRYFSCLLNCSCSKKVSQVSYLTFWYQSPPRVPRQSNSSTILSRPLLPLPLINGQILATAIVKHEKQVPCSPPEAQRQETLYQRLAWTERQQKLVSSVTERCQKQRENMNIESREIMGQNSTEESKLGKHGYHGTGHSTGERSKTKWNWTVFHRTEKVWLPWDWTVFHRREINDIMKLDSIPQERDQRQNDIGQYSTGQRSMVNMGLDSIPQNRDQRQNEIG